MRFASGAAGWLLPVLAFFPATAEESASKPDAPLELDQTERVEVQLVLIDVLAVDRGGRTVPDLSVEDFNVQLDGRRVEIDSLDVACTPEAVGDPRAGETPSPVDGPSPPRKIVLAFDYFHMDAPTEEVFGYARKAVDELGLGAEQHMVVSIGQTVRVEAPFTRDRAAVHAVLDRMYRDRSLYAGHYDRLTERRFYDRLLSLFDLMEGVPGRKVVILFSGPFLADGWTHDPFYRRIAAMSASSRTAIYPVDAAGLRTPSGGVPPPPGGPPKLARLATETGGRFTHNTNDLSLAYARAQRDLGCTYTLGFLDGRPLPDRHRRVSVRVLRDGVRAVHPSGYTRRSREQKLRSMVRTARMASGSFDDGGLEAGTFVVRPVSSNRWEAVLAVAIPAATVDVFHGAGEWHFGGVVRTPTGTPLHSFARRVELEPIGPNGPSLLQQQLRLKPGEHHLDLYLYNTLMDAPLGLPQRVEVPPIPRIEPFFVGPVLGLPTAPVPGASLPPVRPFPTVRLREGDPRASLVHLCQVGAGPDLPRGTVERRLLRTGGAVVQDFDLRNIVFEGHGKVRCQSIVDRIPTESLSPGSYLFEVYTSATGFGSGHATLGFEIAPAVD